MHSGGSCVAAQEFKAVAKGCVFTAGRKLLVSTSAGEEGIDVPNCEFVVRYTATQTGELPHHEQLRVCIIRPPFLGARLLQIPLHRYAVPEPWPACL